MLLATPYCHTGRDAPPARQKATTPSDGSPLGHPTVVTSTITTAQQPSPPYPHSCCPAAPCGASRCGAMRHPPTHGSALSATKGQPRRRRRPCPPPRAQALISPGAPAAGGPPGGYPPHTTHTHTHITLPPQTALRPSGWAPGRLAGRGCVLRLQFPHRALQMQHLQARGGGESGDSVVWNNCSVSLLLVL